MSAQKISKFTMRNNNPTMQSHAAPPPPPQHTRSMTMLNQHHYNNATMASTTASSRSMGSNTSTQAVMGPSPPVLSAANVRVVVTPNGPEAAPGGCQQQQATPQVSPSATTASRAATPTKSSSSTGAPASVAPTPGSAVATLGTGAGACGTVASTGEIDPNAKITIKQFLEFLQAAYQFHGNLEGVFAEEGMHETANWIRAKLKHDDEKRNGGGGVVAAESDKKTASESSANTNDRFKEAVTLCTDSVGIQAKLSEVLNEGLLDSVLPYMLPAQASKKSSVKLDKISSTSSAATHINAEVQKKKSLDILPSRKGSLVMKKTDSEVDIQVCDELRNVKKVFRCNQELLVEKMGYFAEVTNGQRLEDMEISVHCDVGVFEWLMAWVKRENLPEDDRPVLNPTCAIPVLVSAAFLQMEPLIQECLLYCHGNLSEILKTNTSMSCLNDAVLTRLAAMYTNSELEALRDKRDKIQSRLFCKLIQSLCEAEPEAVRGHYCTLGTVYRCRHCQQLIPAAALAEHIPCAATRTTLQYDGRVMPRHVRDPHWSLTEHVAQVYRAVHRSWRRAYWRLWADAHHLYCGVCRRYFPSWQLRWCRYHPDPPQFFSMDANMASAGGAGGAGGRLGVLPVGRYPCCGERAYRFQTLEDRGGCQFREHIPDTKKLRDSSILEMVEHYKTQILVDPPQLVFPDRLTRLVAKEENEQSEVNLEMKENFWWQGIEILPSRERFGLLGSFVGIYEDSDAAQEKCDSPESNTAATTDSELDPDSDSSHDDDSNRSNSDTGRSGSETPFKPTLRKTTIKPGRRKIKPKRKCKLWQHSCSARSNQDLQRSNEEQAFKRMNALLLRRLELTGRNTSRAPAPTSCVADSSPQSVIGANGGVATPPKRSSAWYSSATRSAHVPGGLWTKLEHNWKEELLSLNPGPPRQKNIYSGKHKLKTTRLL